MLEYLASCTMLTMGGAISLLYALKHLLKCRDTMAPMG